MEKENVRWRDGERKAWIKRQKHRRSRNKREESEK